MTLTELKQKVDAILESRPDLADAKVFTEGCDCTGVADDVEIDFGSEIMITRSN